MVEVDGAARPSRPRGQAMVAGPASRPRAVSSIRRWTIPATGNAWRIYALEINLRKSGATHPYAALRSVVPCQVRGRCRQMARRGRIDALLRTV
jgi:hypothetical protein